MSFEGYFSGVVERVNKNGEIAGRTLGDRYESHKIVFKALRIYFEEVRCADLEVDAVVVERPPLYTAKLKIKCSASSRELEISSAADGVHITIRTSGVGNRLLGAAKDYGFWYGYNFPQMLRDQVVNYLRTGEFAPLQNLPARKKTVSR
jgi:hypothetical protein